MKSLLLGVFLLVQAAWAGDKIEMAGKVVQEETADGDFVYYLTKPYLKVGIRLTFTGRSSYRDIVSSVNEHVLVYGELEKKDDKIAIAVEESQILTEVGKDGISRDVETVRLVGRFVKIKRDEIIFIDQMSGKSLDLTLSDDFYQTIKAHYLGTTVLMKADRVWGWKVDPFALAELPNAKTLKLASAEKNEKPVTEKKPQKAPERAEAPVPAPAPAPAPVEEKKKTEPPKEVKRTTTRDDLPKVEDDI